jgi:hypothetical protein
LQWVCSFHLFCNYLNLFSVLDPKRKLDYFRSAGWEEKWIETAREIVEAEFDRGYAEMCIGSDDREESPSVRCIFLPQFDVVTTHYIY